VFSIDKEEKNNSGYLEFKSEFNKSNNGTISKILETEKPLGKSKKKIKIIIIFSKNFIFTIYLEII
jgi:hypothetical protein